MNITKPIIIFGCQRSGTTFLGSLLGANTACICVPEFSSKFIFLDKPTVDFPVSEIAKDWRFRLWRLPQQKLMECDSLIGHSSSIVIDRLVKLYGAEIAQKRFDCWVDHTPENVEYLDKILAVFPHAKFLHLVRDGRGVFASFKSLYWGPSTPILASQFWSGKVGLGLAAEDYLGKNRVKRVIYEDLLANPEAVLKELCEFVELKFQKEMLEGNGLIVPEYTRKQHELVGQRADPARGSSWRKKLSAREIEIFENKAGGYLNYLGYENIFRGNARRPSIYESISQKIKDAFNYHVRARLTLRQKISSIIKER
jgi:hypothetical protein